MHQSFWQTLPRPLIGLSPMDGVTDHPYRYIHKKYGNPALIYTEFTSVEGLCHGAEKLLKEFIFDETQRPVIGQIYGTTPDYFRQATILLCELGYDGIDINMGCPAKNVAHSGAGAALIQTPKLAQQIVKATKQGVTDWMNGMSTADCPDITKQIAQVVADRHQKLPDQYQQRQYIPVSVKTRVGFSHPVVEDWIPTLIETEPEAIGIHGRTLKQQYSGFANWDEIAKAADIAQGTNIPILGNGDVSSLDDALEKIETYHVDGVLIGRATFGNPFVYQAHPDTDHNIFQIALEHCRLFEATFPNPDGGPTYFLPMRKHLGWYVKAIPGAKQLRQQLFQTNTSQEVEAIFKEQGLI